MKIFAIVPVYNAPPDILSSVLNNLEHFVDEIVVIDDGSKENVICQNPKAKCRLLRHAINRGQGAALQTGTDCAVNHGAEIIVHLDGDGQHNPADIPDLIKPIIENQAEFVFGSRFLGKKNNIPLTKKYFILPIAKLINRLYAGLKLSDAHNGLRAFRASIAPFVRLSEDRMAHASEYPYLVKKNNIRYAEAPVTVIYHRYGQGIGSGVKIIKELLTSKILK